MKDNQWHVKQFKKDGSFVIQNDTTYEVKEVDASGNVTKTYIPKEKSKSTDSSEAKK